MIRFLRTGCYLLLMIACHCTGGCKLHRPSITPSRMLEPQLFEPQLTQPPPLTTKAASAAPIRLLDTQSRAHIGRRLLHQQTNGELIEDPVWRWSSLPDHYLDTALHLEVAAAPDWQLVDSGHVVSLGATLLSWHLASGEGMRLVGAVEFQITSTDHVVRTQIVGASEPVSGELPGDLALASGRLLRGLASKGLKLASAER